MGLLPFFVRFSPFRGCFFFAVVAAFFRGCGGFFRGWVVLGVLGFFVSLFRGRCFLFGWCPVPLGCVRGSCVRVVARFRLVRACRVACPRGAWGVARLPRGCRVPAVRLLAVWPPWLFLVRGVVCGLRLRCIPGGVGRLGRCPRSCRPAFVVFLVFFNICRARLWHPLFRGAFFAALNGGI